MKNQIIFHVDVNSAYLSWEAAYRLYHLNENIDLRELPTAIGGNIDIRKGIILAKSIPAKKYGIKTGEVIWQAKQKCPNLYIVPPNYALYDKCSRVLIEVLKEYSPCVEQYSIDEAYVDMTGMEKLWGNPYDAAVIIKNRISTELGFTVNIGISSNKLLAKMASDFKKPDCVHTLWTEEIKDKMWGLPVSDLFFVGNATNKKLKNMGIKTIGELANTDLKILTRHLKKQGELIWAFANGIDCSSVISDPPLNKGYGNSMTIPFDVYDSETSYKILLSLCETVAARLRHDNVKIEIISVGIRDINFVYKSHQMIVLNATNCTLEIYHNAIKLFDELWDHTPIRHLGVHTSRVKLDSYRQYSLFDSVTIDYDKYNKQDFAIDLIRNRYGVDSIKRTTFIDEPLIHHMNGGVS